MALVVNGVCRFALNGFYIDRPWVNILDMQIDTTGTGLDRDDAIYATAGNILNAWVDHIAPNTVDTCVLNSVDWVDLNSATGSTGQRLETSENVLPEAGFVDADPVAGNVAALVVKQTKSARGQRNGRLYRVGLHEGQVVGQGLGVNTVGTLQDAYDDFLAMINDAPLIPVNYSRQLVVVHTTGDSPTVGTYSSVESLVVQSRLATQRRRLRA